MTPDGICYRPLNVPRIESTIESRTMGRETSGSLRIARVLNLSRCELHVNPTVTANFRIAEQPRSDQSGAVSCRVPLLSTAPFIVSAP
jgi:hypothetical protein